MIKVVNIKQHVSFSLNVQTKSAALEVTRELYPLTLQSSIKVYRELTNNKFRRL